MQYPTKKQLVHSDLSGKVIGIILEVYNELGYGQPEKTYQKAVAQGLKKAGLVFVEQLYVPVVFQEKIVGKNYLDFFIENILILEIKRGNYFAKAHIDQVYKYLVSKNLQLGILAYFTPRKVHFKRVVNLK